MKLTMNTQPTKSLLAPAFAVALFGFIPIQSASTTLSSPLNAWAALGVVTEIAPGQFQFTDSQAPNNPQRYYRITSP